MRRKLPQINQNFKGSTFKDGDPKNPLSSRQHMGNANNDTMMGSTSFLDSSCTLPVSRNIDTWAQIYRKIEFIIFYNKICKVLYEHSS